MPDIKKAVVIVGSSRAGATTSASIADYMIEQLRSMGVVAQRMRLNDVFRSEIDVENMLSLIDEADLVIFSFPLYVDTLPYLVTKTYEIIYQRRKTAQNKPTRLFVVVNSGFPEPKQSDTAIGISRRFSKEAGMGWTGAFAIGAGSAILGKPLREMGKKTKNLMEALDIACGSLAEGKEIPSEAFRLVSKGIPAWLYVRAANHVVNKEAAENGILARMHDRPYLR